MGRDKLPNLVLKRILGFIAGLITFAHCSAAPSPQLQIPHNRIHVVVYDAGETLGILPTIPILNAHGVEVIWVPLTPWTRSLLENANQPHVISFPDKIDEMPHLSDRFNVGKIDYWLKQMVVEKPQLVIFGIASKIQEQLATRFKELGIPTVGFYDSFDPASANSIVVKVARVVDEVWVPTEAIKESLRALGIEPVLVLGQPSVENWIRTANEINPADIFRRQGVSPQQTVVLFAGQYGEGYKEILHSFAFEMHKEAASNPNLTVIFSPHPRSDGQVERDIIARFPSSQFMMAASGLTTVELASIAAIVVTWRSTVGIQAAFIGKPVIYYNFTTDEFSNDLITKGLARLAVPDNFPVVLKEMLAQKTDPSLLRQALEKNGYIIGSDKIIAQEILKRLERRER